ncbi:pyridoxal phosphate-dependent aminotransferase family protein [Aquimarina sp. AD10]|uniref:aminotransferase class I/II-fold pyridoxal phosphate-dependent enzyme n=1 Tax=Aquimarina sp. AD10 TaxID=1714849 RepID=UPI000E4E4FFA|nr:pyridoxal phosphate-dependent aminotransferase family protein [Aquimarina sp. AD10]AXT62143.1 pyridoxal phosphate-dependent aminotransferase family protein [Aquimarina sp. AD10]RKM90662.1 aminotransferase class I/II-fold pyridoxal phosphate-dependent enzyme [Aquimarina sp. AD10]
MEGLPKKLQKKLFDRAQNNALRTLPGSKGWVDFSSNDYLGFASSKDIFNETHKLLEEKKTFRNGATGSRLLSGNHNFYIETEQMLAKVHHADAALIFNSGYDANIGFFSSVPQRGDIIFYDELIHASIRDGLQMGIAKSYKFKHNDIDDLQEKITTLSAKLENDNEVYVVTESVFSMDGDSPDLKKLVSFCKNKNYQLVVDEAHALGVFGKNGIGLVQELGLEHQVFARINTFGKAMGCHGAVILGSKDLKSYLINFSRSFIYTTGLPPHSLATIQTAYKELQDSVEAQKLVENISFFNKKIKETELDSIFIKSNSAIHCCIISGNENVEKVARQIQEKGFDVKPIKSPTVAKGKERLRFCLHSFNSKKEITKVIELLAIFAKT